MSYAHQGPALLPNGFALAGSMVHGERAADGSGWLVFSVEEANLGLA